MSRIEKLLDYLKDSEEDSFLQHALALEYIKINEDSKARACFEKILQLDPGYVGSYYHLGKLLERAGDTAGAVDVYERGMVEAKQAGDNHAYNELMGARDDVDG